MDRNRQKLLVAHLIILILLVACSEEDPKPNKSRNVKFEVTGNFSGTIDATYITSSGGGTNEAITALPWSKNIEYASSTTSTAITVGGGGGVAGQTILVKVFAGGSLVSETPGVATGTGIIVVASPAYIF